MDVKEEEETDVFEYTEAEFTWQTQSWADKNPSQFSMFDRERCYRWEYAMANGMFRYDVNHIVTRILPGLKQYICQLNTKRNVIRRTPQVITCVTQPFNHKKFNFNKVNKNEIIFHLRKTTSTEKKKARLPECEEAHKEMDTMPHTIIINVSPMEYGHCLFTPYRTLCLPQVLTQGALILAIETMLLSKHRGFTMGFNSLCANASVNHLHFHCLQLEHELLATYCNVTPLKGQIFEVKSLAINGFALQLQGSSVNNISKLCYNISKYLHDNEIAYNLIICRGVAFGEDRGSLHTTVRLFIWPRLKYIFGSEDCVSFFVACFELAGYLTTFDEATYDCLNGSEVDDIIAAKKLPLSTYETIRNHVIKMTY